MYGQNVEVAAQAISVLSGHMSRDMPLRALKVLFHIAQEGPETVAAIAKAVREPQSAVTEDLRALQKIGKAGKGGFRLVQEIQPVTKGKPCCYRLSKRGDEMMDSLDYTMQVYALPEDDNGRRALVAPDDDVDEPLEDWEASRDLVRG